MALQIVPSARVQQRPRTLADYELLSPIAIEGEPTVRSLRPNGLDEHLLVGATATGPKRVLVQVSGGIAGALYEIRWSPQIAFQVRVTNEATDEPSIVDVKPIQRVVDTVITRRSNGR